MMRTWREAPRSGQAIGIYSAAGRFQQALGSSPGPQKDAEIYGKYMGDAWEMGNSLEIRISPSGIYGNGWLNGIWRAINDCKWGSTGNIIRIQLEVGWNHSNPQKDAAKVGDPGKFRIFPDPFGGCYSRNEDFIHQNEDLINRNDLVGGLEHLDYLSIYWEFHHPN